jgi:DNA/RNA-binding domain of Phe-tRNA-synthetase-like protein
VLAFRYHPDILARFPDVCGGVILIQEMQTGPTPPDLQQAFLAEQQRTLARLGAAPLSELPSLAAWRAAFRAFGVDPTKYRSAAEALLRRLTKKGDIPSINALVDVCNLVSIRYALPVAALDARRLACPVTVRFASGDERFVPHDQPEGETPEPGEVIFSDEAGLVVARRWCWKQSAESTAALDTRQAILTIEAQHANGAAEVQAALADLAQLLGQYTGGVLHAGQIGPGQPGISA